MRIGLDMAIVVIVHSPGKLVRRKSNRAGQRSVGCEKVFTLSSRQCVQFLAITGRTVPLVVALEADVYLTSSFRVSQQLVRLPGLDQLARAGGPHLSRRLPYSGLSGSHGSDLSAATRTSRKRKASDTVNPAPLQGRPQLASSCAHQCGARTKEPEP